MSTGACLSVAIPGLKTPWAVYSARHPGAIIDAVVRPAPPEAKRPPGTMNACLQVRKAPPGTLQGVLADAAQAYGELTTLALDDARGEWLGTYSVLPPRLPDPNAAAVFVFFQEQGLSLHWLRVHEGVAYWRCEVPATMSATAVLKRLRQFLDSMEIVADTAIEDADEADHARAMELDALASGGKGAASGNRK